MARKLILVPRSLERLADTTRIEVGYPKEWTEADMRTWADDLDRYYRTTPAELDAWRQSSQLSEAQRRTLAVESHYMTEPDRGIKGDLREDGMIELAGGRHRAGYLVERGVDPVPVWVFARDERQLDALAADCSREVRALRPGAEPPRTALPEQHRDPDRDRSTPTEGAERAR